MMTKSGIILEDLTNIIPAKFSSNALSCFIKEDDEEKDRPGTQCDGNSSHDELKKY